MTHRQLATTALQHCRRRGVVELPRPLVGVHVIVLLYALLVFMETAGK